MRIATGAGHSPNCDGAQALGYSENRQCRLINARFEQVCYANGVTTYNCDSDAGTQSGYLGEQVRKANAQNVDVAIQWHLNSFNGSARGVEVLYVTERELAERMSAAIAQALGIPNRGAKYRGDLYWLNMTSAPAVLVEACFIDVEEDMDALVSKRDAMVDAAFTAVTGIDPANPVKPTHDPASIWHQVLTERGWSAAQHGEGNFSGIIGVPAYGIRISVNPGHDVEYRVHRMGDAPDKWSKPYYASRSNLGDPVNGYARTWGAPIDGFKAFLYNADGGEDMADYRVTTVGDLKPTEYVHQFDGYAGRLGTPIDKIEIS